jgi:hypothetical protein
LPIHRPWLLWGLVAAGVVAAALAAYRAAWHDAAPAPTPTPTDVSSGSAPSAILAAGPPQVQKLIRQNAPPTQDVALVVPRPAAIAPVVANPADPRRAPVGALPAATPSSPAPPGGMPLTVSGPSTEITVAPLTVATPAEPAAAVAAAAASPVAASRPARDEQIDAAEAALQRGEIAVAAGMLAPLAAAGSARAQALLGRVKDAGRGPQQSSFEAYIWFSLAARNGDSGAIAMRDRIAGRLQPAEIRQAEQLIARWKPRAEPIAGASP